MNATLRRVFARAVAPIAAPACASPERQRLRSALAAQVKAKQDQIAAAAAVERVRQLMRDADTAEDDADAAEAAAIAATQAWAASGAKINETSGNRALLDKAAAAQRRAADAKQIAAGAKNGMPDIESAATDARIAVENAAEEIKTAVAAVLVAQLEPHLETLEQVHRDYVAALEEAMALRMVLKAGGPANAYFPYRSLAGAEAISQRLRACDIPLMTDTDLRPRAGGWVEFARRLATDPDATP